MSDYKIERLKKAYAEWALTQAPDSYAFSINYYHSMIDEMVAKAAAFDRIKAYSDKAINGDIHSLLLAEGIIDVVEQYDINRLSESGEPNAKK